MRVLEPFFVWFPCASPAEWAAHVAALEDALRHRFPDCQRLVYSTDEADVVRAHTVAFHLGAAVLVVEPPSRLGWMTVDPGGELVFVGTDHLPALETPGGIAWIIDDETAATQTNARRDGWVHFLVTVVPGAQCYTARDAQELLPPLPVATWRIPYPEPDVSANLPSVLELTPTTAHGLSAAGDTGLGTTLPLTASSFFLRTFVWEQWVGAPAPVLAAELLGFLWCGDDWTAVPPTWGVGAFALLAQPLGQTTRLTALGDPTVGPLAAAVLDPVLNRELDAERRWSAPVLLPVLPGGDDPLTGQASHSFAQLRPRDHKMMELYHAGKTYKEIAEHLGLRPTYVQRRLTELRRLVTLPYRNERAAERARQRWHERERPLPQQGKKMPTDGKKK